MLALDTACHSVETSSGLLDVLAAAAQCSLLGHIASARALGSAPLHQLHTLCMFGTGLQDLSSLSRQAPALRRLHIPWNCISSLGSLAGLQHLELVDVTGNPLTYQAMLDAPLALLPNLRLLWHSVTLPASATLPPTCQSVLQDITDAQQLAVPVAAASVRSGLAQLALPGIARDPQLSACSPAAWRDLALPGVTEVLRALGIGDCAPVATAHSALHMQVQTAANAAKSSLLPRIAQQLCQAGISSADAAAVTSPWCGQALLPSALELRQAEPALQIEQVAMPAHLVSAIEQATRQAMQQALTPIADLIAAAGRHTSGQAGSGSRAMAGTAARALRVGPRALLPRRRASSSADEHPSSAAAAALVRLQARSHGASHASSVARPGTASSFSSSVADIAEFGGRDDPHADAQLVDVLRELAQGGSVPGTPRRDARAASAPVMPTVPMRSSWHADVFAASPVCERRSGAAAAGVAAAAAAVGATSAGGFSPLASPARTPLEAAPLPAASSPVSRRDDSFDGWRPSSAPSPLHPHRVPGQRMDPSTAEHVSDMTDANAVALLKLKPKLVPQLKSRDAYRRFFSGESEARARRLLAAAYDNLAADERAVKIEKRMALILDVLS